MLRGSRLWFSCVRESAEWGIFTSLGLLTSYFTPQLNEEVGWLRTAVSQQATGFDGEQNEQLLEKDGKCIDSGCAQSFFQGIISK